jgi:hypothetical protein
MVDRAEIDSVPVLAMMVQVADILISEVPQD